MALQGRQKEPKEVDAVRVQGADTGVVTQVLKAQLEHDRKSRDTVRGLREEEWEEMENVQDVKMISEGVNGKKEAAG